MIQDSEEFTFQGKQQLENKDFQNILDSLTSDSLLPNLQKAKVIICDNVSDTKEGHNTPQKRRIQSFWHSYFSDSAVNASSDLTYFNSGNMDAIVNILKQ